jgi:AraC family transcriptional regulator
MFQIRDAPPTHSGALSDDFAPSSSPKKMTSFPDENISSINRTSDFNGFEGLRVVVWQGVKDEDRSTGRTTLPYFMISYRPADAPRSTVAESQGGSAMIPPERAFEATYADARGRSASFRIESGFLADVVRRAGLDSVKLEQAPHGRFLMDLRVDQLCSLLMRETERPAPLAPLYFESLATALVIAVFTQADARRFEAGSLYVQDARIQKAITYIEENFRSKLTRSQMAAAAHLSDSHFSRLFRRVVGFSPEAYVLNWRLRYAAKLLNSRGPDCSIADVAADSGFADQSHFGRLFRRAFGQTPRQYSRQ